MSGAILSPYRWQMFYNGEPAAGALLYSYLSGSATPQPLYTDSSLGTEHDNPVEADANGVFPIMYMAAVAYRITITTSAGVTIFAAQDNVYDLYQLFSATTQTANTVFAGPASGSAAAPTFRALVQADLPSATTQVGVCEGRLTLTSATPVTTADVTGATTVYWTPYLGNRIALFDGSVWAVSTFTEKSIAVPATTATAYDVFIYDNSGTLTLELTAWTNVTTRATALTTQDGVYVKSGALTRRYLGSFVTTGVSGQTEDSFAKRFLWNYYHRVPRGLRVVDATNSWTYTTDSFQQANASAANQLAVMVGLAEVLVECHTCGVTSNSSGGVNVSVTIGFDSTTTAASTVVSVPATAATSGYASTLAFLRHYPTVGYHIYTWLERSAATGTTTWYGDDAGTRFQTGIAGSIDG